MLNAVLDDPHISYFVVVCHPVGHDVARYTRMVQPALLLFDSDDDGHPISVGRRMRKNIPINRWFEFEGSKEPSWLSDNMGREMLTMFNAVEYRKIVPIIGSVEASACSPKIPDLSRLAGGVLAWGRLHGREIVDNAIPLRLTSGDIPLKAAVATTIPSGDSSCEIVTVDPGVWQVRVDALSKEIRYVHAASGESRSDRPAGAFLVREDGSRELAATGASHDSTILFDADVDEEKIASARRAESQAVRSSELA